MVLGGDGEGVDQRGVAGLGCAFELVEEALGGEGPFFCFRVLLDGVEVLVG